MTVKNESVKPPSRILEPVSDFALKTRVEDLTNAVVRISKKLKLVENDDYDSFLSESQADRTLDYFTQKEAHQKAIAEKAVRLDYERRAQSNFVEKVCKENLRPIVNGKKMHWDEVHTYQTDNGIVRLNTNDLAIDSPDAYRGDYQSTRAHLISTYTKVFSYGKSLITEDGRGIIDLVIGFEVA